MDNLKSDLIIKLIQKILFFSSNKKSKVLANNLLALTFSTNLAKKFQKNFNELIISRGHKGH